MTPPPVPVSVVVPTFDRRARVLALLEALGRQTLPPSHFEAVVCIDGSTDGTRAALERLAPAFATRVIEQARRGRAAALNAGIAASTGELIVLLDDDMEPVPGCLAAHQRAHAGGARLGVMGAVPMPVDAAAAPAARYIAAKFNGHLANLARADRPLLLTDFYSGNFSIRRDVLAGAGGFDEDFSEYGNEDLELSVRLARAGVTITYDADACAWQFHDKTFAALAADSVAEGRTAVIFALKHPEVVPRLKLGTYGRGPRTLRALRDALLRLTRGAGTPPRWLLALESGLSRLDPPGTAVFYRLALGYLYWLGARQAIEQAQRSGRAIGPLAALARELRL